MLGYSASILLDLIKFAEEGPGKINSIEIEEDFKDRFEGIGKMNNTSIKLHIDSSVKPIVQKARRIPFHIRSQVETELDRLENLDLIEKASGPTPWVSPIVPVKKMMGSEFVLISGLLTLQ